MANLNDAKIIELKKQIEEKKKSVGKAKKFSPVTNCSIELDGVRINIQTLNKEQIVSLLVKLNSYAASAIDLGLLEQYSIGGYGIGDWIGDLKSKLDFINSKDEEQKLKLMESKLDKLLSDDKKVELELNEIAEMLNS